MGRRTACLPPPSSGPLSAASRRDIRFTVPLCIILICGSFAATALLQMRLDRSHALAQAAQLRTGARRRSGPRRRRDPGPLCPDGRGVRRQPRAISQRRSAPRRARHPRHRGVGRKRRPAGPPGRHRGPAAATARPDRLRARSFPAGSPSAKAAAPWRCCSIPASLLPGAAPRQHWRRQDRQARAVPGWPRGRPDPGR